MRTGLILIFAAGLLARPMVSQNGPGETAEAGAIVRGQAIFEGQGKCLTCHFVANHGSLVGTDLTEIGLKLTPLQLRDALVHPRPEGQRQNQLYTVVTRDGTVHTGKLLNQDHFSLQLLDATGKPDGIQEGRPARLSPGTASTDAFLPGQAHRPAARRPDRLLNFSERRNTPMTKTGDRMDDPQDSEPGDRIPINPQG